MRFNISEKFYKAFKNYLRSDDKFFIFKKHSDLDNFIKKFGDKNRNRLLHDKQFTDELFLLKSFDRAFWLMGDDHDCKNCPFQDPTRTNSFANLKDLHKK